MTDLKNSALVIAGHGSTQNPDSSAPTRVHADEIRRRGIFSEVACCFWKEEPYYRDVLGMVKSQEVFVVPNFISEGYFAKTVIPREMALDGPLTRRGGRTIRYCEPAGNHARMTSLLIAEARAVAPDVPPAETSLVIVGHGTGRDENSAEAARKQVRLIAKTGDFAEVLSAYMEEAPLIAEWHVITTQPNVVVIPFFISDGLHSYQDIPVLLGIAQEPGKAASQSDVFKHNPHNVCDRRLYYGSAIGTDPGFADIILDQAAAFVDPVN
ncbi:MAG: cobalamin biosynthesis protein CbiX [Verrucomicrobiaceae bacterium]|nr:MAG: cobalamin biosynthesis protein CbiX [Verrucomicrobiaceae bacterium]